jgi:hypothetical protein
LFIGSAFALGVICARVLKSSPPAEQRYGAYGAYGAGGAGGSPNLGGYRDRPSPAGRDDYQRLNPSVSSPSPSASSLAGDRTSTKREYSSHTENR